VIELNMEKRERVQFWWNSAKKNVVDAEDNWKIKHYDWCLFIWGLALEKLLKAQLIAKEKEIVFTHNLIKLAQDAGYKLSESEYDQLAEINTFNINVRYDDYKFEFYKKATESYAKVWRENCKILWEKFEEGLK